MHHTICRAPTLNINITFISIILDALLLEAAQGKIIHNDDTTAKILPFIIEQDPQNGRTGIFTTGIVSRFENHRIALFMTGDRHAGENLNDLLQRRAFWPFFFIFRTPDLPK